MNLFMPCVYYITFKGDFSYLAAGAAAGAASDVGATSTF